MAELPYVLVESNEKCLNKLFDFKKHDLKYFFSKSFKKRLTVGYRIDTYATPKYKLSLLNLAHRFDSECTYNVENICFILRKAFSNTL